jgi:hypothetical protein
VPEHNRNQRRADNAELLNALPYLSIERASIPEALAEQLHAPLLTADARLARAPGLRCVVELAET